jgi:hypothetical protein
MALTARIDKRGRRRHVYMSWSTLQDTEIISRIAITDTVKTCMRSWLHIGGKSGVLLVKELLAAQVVEETETWPSIV